MKPFFAKQKSAFISGDETLNNYAENYNEDCIAGSTTHQRSVNTTQFLHIILRSCLTYYLLIVVYYNYVFSINFLTIYAADKTLDKRQKGYLPMGDIMTLSYT